MTDRSKIIFVNVDGDFEETAAADTLKFASFKTATYELTDALLGDVVNKMIKSDGSRAFAADQSHGGFKIINLADGVAASDAATFGQLSRAVNGFDWKPSVRASTTAALPAVVYSNGTAGVGATLTASANAALPAQDGVTLVVGDRMLVKDQAAGLQNGLYVVSQVGSGAAPFILTRTAESDENYEVTANLTVSVEEGTLFADHIFQLQTNNPIVVGTTALVFSRIISNNIIGGAGIALSGETIAADLYTAGGLQEIGAGDAGQLAVKASDIAGVGLVGNADTIHVDIDFSTLYNDAKAVKASDMFSQAAGKGASNIGINDAGNYTAVTTVEAALQELYGLSGSKQYTVGTGGVTKGDLVYASANNTVTKMPINALYRPLGSALSTATAGQSVAVQGFDYVIVGALSGAVAGAEYFWSGSALSIAPDSTAGNYVWKAGVAVNATDLLCKLEHVKKNS